MPQTRRSGCPINLTLEQIGDRWSLIVIRDVMFENRRSYGTLLEQNQEGIATNILASRLKHLTASGLLTRCPDPNHHQKGIYSLTEAAIQLVPLLAQMAAWGLRHTQASKEASLRAERLERGGPHFGVPLWMNSVTCISVHRVRRAQFWPNSAPTTRRRQSIVRTHLCAMAYIPMAAGPCSNHSVNDTNGR
ncbi:MULTISPECIES: winged helix-turn-helix transcriptional regulator [Dickeya]|uniref:winged helix-turn-helix transcriptional regulator n=1 Tax=Dickeya TaxID=204037 RepID=UPI000A70E512|nr:MULTISPECIES: helix-turn-helix domain-containing protein [Dickeya]